MDRRALLHGKHKSLALRGLAGAMALLFSSSAMASRCPDPNVQAMLELSALKTELMVVAITCQQTDAYNAFIDRYRSALAANDKAVIDHFTWRDKRAGQRANDAYVTNLANSRTQEASRVGADFCSRNTRLFQEVMGLQGMAELPLFAASKDLIPASMGACPAENNGPARTPAPTTRSARR